MHARGVPGWPAGQGAAVGAGAPPKPPWDLFRVAVVLLLWTYVWRFQDLFPMLGAVAFPMMVAVAAVGLFMLTPTAPRMLNRLRHPVIKLAGLILLLMVISVPASLYPGLSVRFLLRDHLKTLLMVALIVVSVRSFADVERYAAAHVGGGALYALLSLTRFEVGESGRLGELAYYDSNDLGMLLVSTLPLIVYFLRKGARWQMRLFALGVTALYVMAIVRTGSRGAFIGLVAVGGFLLLAFRALPVRVRVGWMAAAALLLAVVAQERYWELMNTLLHPTQDYNWSGQADEGRMEVWKRGLGYMARRPLTGVGVRNFPVAEGTISPIADRQKRGIGLKWSAAHNSFVEIGAELGVLGLVGFVAMLWAAYRTLRRIRRQSTGDPRAQGQGAMAEALIASLVGFLVPAVFLSQAYSIYLYSLLGLIAGFAVISGDRPWARPYQPRWAWTAVPSARPVS